MNVAAMTPEQIARWGARYQVSVAQLTVWLAGGCGIDGCTRPPAAIDHDHDCCVRAPTCGECTRGVLCTRHNTGLEAFMDAPAVVAYLRRTPAGRRTLIGVSGITSEQIPRPKPRRQLTQQQREIKRRIKSRNKRLGVTPHPRDRRPA